jgi:DNA-binding transcriptional MocR family regulator
MSEPVRYQLAGRTAAAISEDVEARIGAGQLQPGEQLPPVRALATELGVSPGTVAAAYATLRRRGITVGDGRRGTRVAGRPALAPPNARPALSPLEDRPAAPGARPALAPPGDRPGAGTQPGPPGGQRGRPEAAEAALRDLAAGNPDPTLLPDLRRYLARLAAGPAAKVNRLYGGPTQLPELVDLAAQQLGADGIPVNAVTIVSGALDGIERVLAARLRPGDRVAVEDPGYPAVFDLLGALGLQPVAVAVDDDGLLPDHLEHALTSGVAAVVFSPRAQNPTGAALSETRTTDLGAVLDRHPAVLTVEDDHAGPVAGAPYRTLASPERSRWAVIRSVSKSLGPDLRLAVVAADSTTAARVEGRHAVGAGWVSHLLQQLVLLLWSDPAVTQQLQSAETQYGARRHALIQNLSALGLDSHGRSGLNVWVPLPSEQDAVMTLRRAGLVVRAGERFRQHTQPAIRITVAGLATAEAAAVAEHIAGAVTAPPGRRLG